jgi:1-deoxy-D-xylulose-5-phosphate synthase
MPRLPLPQVSACLSKKACGGERQGRGCDRDGALTGGLAFEALNHAGQLQKDLVVILNDNEMSISRNTGALSTYLSRITAVSFYQHLRDRIDRAMKVIPLWARGFSARLSVLKRA